MTDGGGSRGLNPAQSRRLRREEITLARQRTEQLGDIVTLLEDGDLGVGGGGGGGGAGSFGIGLSALTGAAAGGGGAGILSRFGGLAGLATNPITGVLAAGAGAGLGLREIFQDFSDQTNNTNINREPGVKIAEALDVPPEQVFEGLNSENVPLRNVDDIDTEVARAVADGIGRFDTRDVKTALESGLRSVDFQSIIQPPGEEELTDEQNQETATTGGGSGVQDGAGISERRRDFIINNNVEFSGPTQREIEKQIDKSVQQLKRDIRKELPRGVGP
jgi:hypothetical protein